MSLRCGPARAPLARGSDAARPAILILRAGRRRFPNSSERGPRPGYLKESLWPREYALLAVSPHKYLSFALGIFYCSGLFEFPGVLTYCHYQ